MVSIKHGGKEEHACGIPERMHAKPVLCFLFFISQNPLFLLLFFLHVQGLPVSACIMLWDGTCALLSLCLIRRCTYQEEDGGGLFKRQQQTSLPLTKVHSGRAGRSLFTKCANAALSGEPG